MAPSKTIFLLIGTYIVYYMYIYSHNRHKYRFIWIILLAYSHYIATVFEAMVWTFVFEI